jgi:hypothetical protein
MTVRSKAGTGAVQRKAPVHHKTTQGSGRGSKPKPGKKSYRGQGR